MKSENHELADVKDIEILFKVSAVILVFLLAFAASIYFGVI